MKQTIIILAIALTTLACCKKKTTTDTNYFSCNVNGTPYYMNKTYVFNSMSCSEGNEISKGSAGELRISSNQCQGYDFTFHIFNPQKDSTYILKNLNSGNTGTLDVYVGDSFDSNDSLQSNLKLTEYSNHNITGTFNGIFICSYNKKKITISDGKFSLTY